MLFKSSSFGGNAFRFDMRFYGRDIQQNFFENKRLGNRYAESAIIITNYFEQTINLPSRIHKPLADTGTLHMKT